MTANRTAKKETTNLGTTLSDVAWVLPLSLDDMEEFATQLDALPNELDAWDGRNAFMCDAGSKYLPAVEHWARIRGGPVPWPNDESKRLSPEFAEWMFGLPLGYTDVGISRSARLRCLDNMVAPAQAALAIELLIPELTEEGD